MKPILSVNKTSLTAIIEIIIAMAIDNIFLIITYPYYNSMDMKRLFKISISFPEYFSNISHEILHYI
ncbi:hypothetical protein MASR1M45_11710 [Candidatus Kapaibacterium sp.]